MRRVELSDICATSRLRIYPSAPGDGKGLRPQAPQILGSGPQLRKRSRIGAAALALVAIFAFQSAAQSQASFASSSNDAPLTFSADVASIIQENCTVCHREGGIGPMELVTYENVRTYAPLIKMKVANRLMPPYYYDNDVGIQDLKEDWRLSDEDINTIVSWVDQGAPLGNADEIPELNLLDTDDWSLSALFGPPDLLAPSTPIDVPADGLDMWHRPMVEIQGLPEGGEERCIKALQVKPRGVAKTVVHHANSTFQLLQEDGSFEASGDRATEYAMGKLGEIIPDGVCRVIPPDAYIRWDIHMYPGGLGMTAANDVIEGNVVDLGIWLHPADYEYEYKQDLSLYGIRQGELVMPPPRDGHDSGLPQLRPSGPHRQLPTPRAPAAAVCVFGDLLPGDWTHRDHQHDLQLERHVAPEPPLRG